MDMEMLGRSDFPFWGRRQYVQISHLTEGFLEVWDASGRSPLERVFVDIREQVRSNSDFVILDPVHQSVSAVRFHCYTNEGMLVVGVIPNGTPIKRRLKDDEADLVARSEVNAEKRFGAIEKPNSERLIATMVALVKKVHKASLPSEGYGQWFATGLDLDVSVMAKAGELSMSSTIDREVGRRMTRSTVMLDYYRVATISFYREAVHD